MSRTIEIIPAVMPQTAQQIESAASKLKAQNVSTLQIDIMDGKYTRDSTWPFTPDSGLPLDLKKLEGIKIELDLMVKEPIAVLAMLRALPIKRVILHRGAFEGLSDLQTACEFVVDKGFDCGVAMTISDSIEDLTNLSKSVDTIQVMGIPVVGVQHMPFDARAAALVKKVSDILPSAHINVDGGMRPQTARQVVRNGATRIVSGSFLLADKVSFKENLNELKGAVDVVV